LESDVKAQGHEVPLSMSAMFDQKLETVKEKDGSVDAPPI
jgi:hypothetical protein